MDGIVDNVDLPAQRQELVLIGCHGVRLPNSRINNLPRFTSLRLIAGSGECGPSDNGKIP